MAGLLYYLPGLDKVTPERLELLRFPHAECVGSAKRIDAGPDGGPGWLFALDCIHPNGREPALVYDHADLWRKYLGGVLWCAVSAADPPRPIDFLRVLCPVGHDVRMADGSDWVVCPIVTRDGDVILPTDEIPYEPVSLADWAEPDRTRTVVRGEYADFARAAELLRTHSAALTPPDAFTLFGYAIARNYRLSLWECGPLGLLDADTLGRILLALIDHPMEVSGG